MKDTTNRRALTGECISGSSNRSYQEPPAGSRPERLADLLAQFVPALNRDAAEAYVQDRIAFKVDRLVDKFGLDDSDRDDLEQDLLAALVQAMRLYDAKRSQWKTFVCRVLDRRYRHLLRKLLTPENNGAPSVARFEAFGDDYEESVVDPATAGGTATADDLRMDVDAVVSTMPNRLQVIARLLMAYLPSEAARFLCTSPAAITRAMARMRPYFEQAGLSPF